MRVSVFEKAMDGLRADYPVVEFVVDILHIHLFHLKALTPAKLGQSLRGLVEMLVRDEEIIRAPFRSPPVGRRIEGDG